MKHFARIFLRFSLRFSRIFPERRSKGFENVANVMGAVFITAIVIFLFYYIFPLFFGDMFKSIALSSAEIVTRDMAGFVSVSGVAPNEIRIKYNPSSSTLYNVSIANRVVKVAISSGKLNNNEIASSKTAVDNLTQQINNDNSFVISKNIKASTDQNGNKIFRPVYSVIGTSNLGVK
jgi:hypothetical protein